MARRVPIKLNIANALKLLGSLYRNPADAIKEHVSNALDEHRQAEVRKEAEPVCSVIFTLERDRIIIEYPYGMNRKEFEAALERVADSIKKSLDIAQIGQLGIGMFSFFQIGKKCTFLTRKSLSDETFRVTLREGSDNAEFESVSRREELPKAGIKIIISQLSFDPTKPRGPLSPERLQKVLAEKFDQYIRKGTLDIRIISRGRTYLVEPLKIELPRVGAKFDQLHLSKDYTKKFSFELYFDPSGKGKVGIRHTGVTVVEDIKQLQAYGLEESVFASGDVKGFIDADFLKPLPARVGFEENEDWISLLDELYRYTGPIEEEVELLKQQELEKKLTEIQKRAIELASEILDMEEFRDLETLQGLGKREHETRKPPNGFDFVPPAVRANVGERAHLLLKAEVPGKIPNRTKVLISVNDPSISLEVRELFLKEEDALDGLVSYRVYFRGSKKLVVPASVTARANGIERQPEAHVMIGEPGPERVPRSEGEPGREGLRFQIVETPFEDGTKRHSEFIKGTLRVNTLNPDFRQEKTGTDDAKMAYDALMIGKETIAHNDRSGKADEYLERMLSFYFKLKSRIVGAAPLPGKRPRGRPRKMQTA